MAQVEVFGKIIAKTDWAILLRVLVMQSLEVEDWVPLSLIRTDDDLRVGNHVTIEIPEWLVIEKGLA